MNKKLMIAFIGIDGSGKTSIIKGVKKKLEKDGEKVRIVYMGLGSSHHFKPLKWIMNLRSKSRRKKSGGDEKKLRKQNYRERSFVWVLGQFSELFARYFEAKKLSKNEIILFDRYFYDGLILSGESTASKLRRIVPRPDISFIITAKPKTIWERKKEADLEDIKNFYNNSKKIEKYFNMRKIDNNKPLKEVVEEVYKIINSKR